MNLHLSVMSINVNGSKEPAGVPGRLRRVAAHPASADARILLLQELPASLRPHLVEIFPGMEPVTWMNSVTERERRERMGLATLTNLSVRERRRVSFKNPHLTGTRGGTALASHAKGALLTTLTADPKRAELIAVNVHALPFNLFDVPDDGDVVAAIWEGFGAEVVPEVGRTTSGAAVPTPVLIAGDFNVSDRSAVEAPLAELRLRTTFSMVATRPSGRRTDDIYVPTDAETLDASVEDVGSDHYLLRVELDLPMESR